MKILTTLLNTATLTIYTPYLWLIAALAFLLLEAAVPGLFFFISFALGSAVAAAAAFLDTSFTWQCTLGLFSSIAAFFIIQRWLKRDGLSSYEATNVGTMTGLHGTVTRKLVQNGTGSVKVGGETWSAKAYDSNPLALGTLVRVIRIEGNKLIVKAIQQ